MRVELGPTEINTLTDNRYELWTMPTYDGYPAVNLCSPNWPRRPASVSSRPQPLRHAIDRLRR
jgi:hypothetical protein